MIILIMKSKPLRILQAFVVLTTLLSLCGCPDPNGKIFFWKNDKKTDKIKIQFDNKNLEIKIDGTRALFNDSTIALTLYISLKAADSTLVQWDNSKAIILIDGQPMRNRNDKDTLTYYQSSHDAHLSLYFKRKVDLSTIWIGKEKRPVSPEIQIVLDSAFIWKSERVVLDTIEAFIEVPRYESVFFDYNELPPRQRELFERLDSLAKEHEDSGQ